MQKPLLAVLMSSAFLTLNAQAADLIQVYKQALANDATYASARAALAAGQERTTQGRAGLLPTISATGTNTKNNGDFTPYNVGDVGVVNGQLAQVTARNTDNYTNLWQVQLTQPLFRWANWENYQQSKLQQSVAEATFAHDLHVLSTPPAFILSQDQTLQFRSFSTQARLELKWTVFGKYSR